MDGKSFSFVIPAFNDAPGIQRHFEYFAQRHEQVQLVIVDDCSEDDTAEFVEQAKLPPNITIDYRLQAQNAGPAKARNDGLQMAHGDFVMFLDADDVLSDHFFLYIGMSPLARGADFVLFKYHLAKDHDERFSYNMHEVDNRFFSRITDSGFPGGMFKLEELPGALMITNFPWNKIYRKEFIKNSGLRFPEMRMHEDILPHWHSFLAAKYFGVLNWAPPLITHFEDPGGNRATNYIGEERLQAFASLKQIFKEIDEHPSADKLLPEFRAFAENLFEWLAGNLCSGSDPQSRTWRLRYIQAAQHFWRDIEEVHNSVLNNSSAPN